MLLHESSGFEEGGIAEKGSILDGEGDAGHVLVDDASSAHGHMTDFAIPGGIPWQTN